MFARLGSAFLAPPVIIHVVVAPRVVQTKRSSPWRGWHPIQIRQPQSSSRRPCPQQQIQKQRACRPTKQSRPCTRRLDVMTEYGENSEKSFKPPDAERCIILQSTYTEIRWCWARRWPWTRFLVRCASIGSFRREIFHLVLP